MAQDQQEPQDDDEGRDALAGAPIAEVELEGEVPASSSSAGSEAPR